MRFTHAIVRRPASSMLKGISTAGLGRPDYKLALEQHRQYCNALEACGLEVQVLQADEHFPDSCFVEDVALVTPDFAVLTNPGAASRNGEKEAMEPVLRERFEKLHRIEAPGTLDAGDVMMVGGHFFIGLSERTNPDGATQLISILERYGRSGETVPLSDMLHLKSGMSYLEEDCMLAAGEFIGHPVFDGIRQIAVRPEEEYAANSLWINGTVLVPAGFPRSAEAIRGAGYHILEVDVSEYRKLDGGLSCLSLRF